MTARSEAVEAAARAVVGAAEVEDDNEYVQVTMSREKWHALRAALALPQEEGTPPARPCKCGAINFSEGKTFLPAGLAHSRAFCQPAPPPPQPTERSGT